MLQKIRVNWVTTYISTSVCSFFAGLPSVSTPDDYYSSDDYYSYSSDDDYLNHDEKVVHTNPTFLSDSTNDWVNEGETIKLPCLVDKLGIVKSFLSPKVLVPFFVQIKETGTLFQHQSVPVFL